MEQSLLSIIVPVYNVEEFIDECLESIVRQTYHNLEIIVVDDGSTDSSGKKCDEWSECDNRIVVIHKKNGGLSDARNAGLEIAKGKYIGFVDSDDVIHPQMYQRLYETLQQTDSEISCCGVQKIYTAENFSEQKIVQSKAESYTDSEALLSIIKDEKIRVTVWNKLYMRNVIGNTVFEFGRCHEDEFWSYRIFGKTKKIVVLDEKYYGYRQRENSIMSRKYSVRNLDILEARAERLRFLEENYPELVNEARCDFRFTCIRAMQLSMMYVKEEAFQECRQRILGYVKTHPLHYKEYCGLPLGRRLWCIMSNISFERTCRIRNKFHYAP